MRKLVNRSARCLFEQAGGISSRTTDSDLQKIETAFLSKHLSFSDVLELLSALHDINSTAIMSGEDEELQVVLTNGTKDGNLLVPFLLCKVSTSILSNNVAYGIHIFKQCLKIAYDLKADTLITNLGLLVYNRQCTPLLALQLAHMCANDACETAGNTVHVIKTYKLKQQHINEIVSRYQQPPWSLQIRNLASDLVKERSAEADKSITDVIAEMQASGITPDYLQNIKSILDGVAAFRKRYHANVASVSGKCRNLAQYLKQHFSNPSSEILSEIIWYLSTVVKHCKGYYPRVTQQTALANLLLAKRVGSSCLLEVSTGEGKSTVIAMLAAILAMCGFAVDIITSSEVLASRDAKEWRTFYSFFDLTCASIPPDGLQQCKTREEIDDCYQKIYCSDMVYGTVNDFAGDTLRQEFLKYNTKGSRSFQVVIVDEVDYLTLDYGLQWTYLSHKTTGLWHIDQLLAMIWFMCSIFRPVRDPDDGITLWSSSPLQDFQKMMPILVASSKTDENGASYGMSYEEVVSETDAVIRGCAEQHGMQTGQRPIPEQSPALMSRFSSRDLRDVCSQVLDIMNVSETFDIYILGEDGSVDKCNEGGAEGVKQRILLTDNGKCCTLQERELLICETVHNLEEKIKYSSDCQSNSSTLTEETENGIIVPTFLKAYVSNRLPVFVEHAFRAIQMSKGREYLIVDDPDDVKKQRKIVPIDYNASGVLEMNKKWSNGLQQFLEMKHGLAISRMSTITNFMSNFRLFQRYLEKGYIFGVTGTLGDDVDRAYLKRHFSAECYTIPTHRQSKLSKLPMMQENGYHEWKRRIHDTVKYAISKQSGFCRGQAVLLVCEDLKTAEEFRDSLRQTLNIDEKKLFLYTRSDIHKRVVDNRFRPGDVIITTNLGGRGTDFTMTDAVNGSGGLFVVLTFFPRNYRVEKQLMGRTARMGQPGSFQLILDKQTLPSVYQGETIEFMYKIRTACEEDRLQNEENTNLSSAIVKERLFSTFCTELDKFSQRYSERERQGISSMTLKELSEVFKESTEEFDFEPAKCALIEKWAFWLEINESRIDECRDAHNLQVNLQSDLWNYLNNLRRGFSDNPYIYSRQAVIRMQLIGHEQKKPIENFLDAGARFLRAFSNNSSGNSGDMEAIPPGDDYGTRRLWQKCEERERVYKAVALYNKAYVIVKMRRQDYKTEAFGLLENASKAIDAYLQEIHNSVVLLSFTDMYASSDQRDQFETTSNFKRQQQIRLTFFQSWKDTVNKAMQVLKENAQNDSSYILAKKLDVSSSSKDPLAVDEKELLHDLGITCFFELKKETGWMIFVDVVCRAIDVLGVAVSVFTANPFILAASRLTSAVIKKGVTYLLKELQGISGGGKFGMDAVKSALGSAIQLGLSVLPVTSTIMKFVPEGARNFVEKLFSASDVQTANVFSQADFPTVMKTVGKEFGKEISNSTVSKLAQEQLSSGVENFLEEKVNNLLQQYKSTIEQEVKIKNHRAFTTFATAQRCASEDNTAVCRSDTRRNQQ